MTKKEVMELFRQTEEELENNPELCMKALSEVETMRLEHPEFFDRMKDLTLGEMSRKDLKEMFDLLQSHVRKNRMAN